MVRDEGVREGEDGLDKEVGGDRRCFKMRYHYRYKKQQHILDRYLGRERVQSRWIFKMYRSRMIKVHRPWVDKDRKDGSPRRSMTEFSKRDGVRERERGYWRLSYRPWRLVRGVHVPWRRS